MAFLLDTVALVLWWSDDARLGAGARSALSDAADTSYLSSINVWEIASKNRIGKLDAFGNFARDFDQLVRRDGFKLLGLAPMHAMRAGYLPGEHRDPFDRLIAGQALVEGMTVLTNDPQIAAFGCETLW